MRAVMSSLSLMFARLRFPIFISLFAAGLVLTGCGGETMNVKEAEAVSLAYTGKSFTPPPRSIDDIVKDLKWYEDKQVTHRCGICEQQPEPNASISERVELLSHQGVAEHHRGRSTLGIERLNQAVAMMEASARKGVHVDRETASKVYSRLHILYQESGRFSSAIKYAEKNARDLDRDAKGRGGQKQYIYSSLTHLYAETGQISKARSAYSEARNMFNTLTSRHGSKYRFYVKWQGDMASAAAHLAQAQGDLRRAEDAYRESIRWYREYVDGHNMYQQNHMVRNQGLYLVNNLLEQGRLAEAEVESREAIRRSLTAFGRNASATATAVMGMAKVMMARGRFEDAAQLAEIAQDIMIKTGADKASNYYAHASNLLGEAQLGQLNHKAALETFDGNGRALRGDDLAYKTFVGTNLNYAITLLRAGRLDDAATVAEAAEKTRQDMLGKDHYSVREAHAVVELVYAARGNKAEAITSLASLLPVMAREINDRSSDQVEPGATQVRFRIIAERYLAMLAEERGRSQEMDDLSLQAAQMAQSQAVQRALAASAARATIRDPELVKLVRTEQDAARKIDAAYNALSQAMAEAKDAVSASATKGMQDQIVQLRKARDSIREEIAKRYPDYDRLVRPRPSTLAEVRANLRPQEVLVAFYFGEAQGYVWAVPRNGPVAMAVIPLGREAIDRKVARLRGALDSGAQSLAEVPAFDVAASHELYRLLLEPVAGAWKDAESLAVVPHASLASLPIGTFVTSPANVSAGGGVRFEEYRNVAWLARSHATSYLPSISALATLRAMPMGAATRGKFAGFGNPVFGAAAAPATQVAMRGGIRVRGLRRVNEGSLDNKKILSSTLDQLVALPETADEVTEVAKALGADTGTSVFTGTQASEQQVTTMPLADRRIVMFATHALLPGDLDGLDQPAIALSSPAATQTQGDGLLTMAEVLGLKLDADWVVLSACNTGAASGKGADAVSGLGMAFFYAGSRALLVTHWPVETNSARALTTDLFHRQTEHPDLTRAGAMAETQRAMIEKGGYKNAATGTVEFAYAHPMFWAPFTLIGDGRGSRI